MSINGEEASSPDQQKAMAGTGPRHQTQPGGKAASARDAAGASAGFLAGVPVTAVLGWGSWHGNQQAGSLGRLAMMCAQKRWAHRQTPPAPPVRKGGGLNASPCFQHLLKWKRRARGGGSGQLYSAGR